MTHTQLIDRLRRMQGTQKTSASNLGISAAYLSDVINGRRDPGKKLLDALGLERVVTYKRKGKA